MKNICLHVICCILFITVIIPGSYAKAQEGASPVPQLTSAEQKAGDLKSSFGSITAVGTTLYINAMNVWFFPPDVASGVNPYMPTESQSQRVIRVIDFSNPQDPVLINEMPADIDMASSSEDLAISGGYFYVFTGENDLGPFTADDYPYGPVPPAEANLSIFKIQDNEKLIKVKDLSLTDTLDSVRNGKELLCAQKMVVTDTCAYLIFYGLPRFEPSTYTAPPEAGAYYPLPQTDADSTAGSWWNTPSSPEDDTVVPPDSSAQPAVVASYAPPENNTVIVTVDLTDPSQAKVLGATRLNIDSPGACLDFVVAGNVGYLNASSHNASSLMSGRESKLYVLNLSSPGNIAIISSLEIYGDGGQLVKEGNKLYIAAQNFGLEIVDISDPLAPKMTGWIETPHPFMGMMYVAMGGYRNIFVKGNYAYLLDNEYGLLVIDVSNPSSPKQVASYTTKYVSASSYANFPGHLYFSVESCGDYLFLRNTGSNIEIISIANPLSPTLIGLFGEREPMVIDVSLKLEAAELLDFQTEQTGEGDIALFGISSLDALNRKYGVSKIEKHDSYPTNYWLDQPLPKDYNYSVEDIRKDRSLRRFYVTIQASADIKAVVADYRKNPSVITADETDTDDLFRRMSYGSYAAPEGDSAAYGSSGYAYSAPVKDTIPPEDATDFSATAGDQEITLSWTSSIDTAKDLFAQLLYIDSGNGYEDPIYLDKDVKTYEITGLQNGESYTVKLAAVDSQHNESEGVTATVTPQAPRKAQTLSSLFQIPFWGMEVQPVIQLVPAVIQIGNFGLGTGWGNTRNSGWDTGFGAGWSNGFDNGWGFKLGFGLDSAWCW